MRPVFGRPTRKEVSFCATTLMGEDLESILKEQARYFSEVPVESIYRVNGYNPGDIIKTSMGEFKVERALGRGGMGSVFAVRNEKNELFSLKIYQKKSNLESDYASLKQAHDDGVPTAFLPNVTPDFDKNMMLLKYIDGINVANLLADENIPFLLQRKIEHEFVEWIKAYYKNPNKTYNYSHANTLYEPSTGHFYLIDPG